MRKRNWVIPMSLCAILCILVAIIGIVSDISVYAKMFEIGWTMFLAGGFTVAAILIGMDPDVKW